ncbi:MAG: response regulator transcription factor [Rhodocyclaceae bacterium]|nr:MAG: response regulator transcription factor [Rhodocyclaceae bacterium]
MPSETPAPPRHEPDQVLIVDDVPENLAVLHDALDESGYTVFVATDGEQALRSVARHLPDIILLDAVMPGMDGFEVCRRLKADAASRAVPVIFMTGLTESEHVVAGFRAGGADYVTKPVRTHEMLARVASHLLNARQMRQAHRALDASGQAMIAVKPDDLRLVWETPYARRLLDQYFPEAGFLLPAAAAQWLRGIAQWEPWPTGLAPLTIPRETRRLLFVPLELNQDGALMLTLREESDELRLDNLMQALGLTRRESEVLYWLTRGKTNRDIGDILGTSPRTVNKHLEHVFVKLGVETRTAAAALAMQQLQMVRP